MEDAAMPLPSPRHLSYHAVEAQATAAKKNKGRALSEHGFLHQAFSADAAKRAMASAFSSVSRMVNPATATTSSNPDDERHRIRSHTATSGWKLPSLSLPAAMPMPSYAFGFRGVRRPAPVWKGGRVEYVAARYELHGDDAGALSSYYHIVADGGAARASASTNASASVSEKTEVTSAVLARQLVQTIEDALEDATNRNRTCLDAAALEHLVTECVNATRMQCLRYKNQQKGTNLACSLGVVYFDRWHSRLYAFTVGDVKCVVVRKNAVVFESTSTQLEVHVPCAVSLDAPLDIDEYAIESLDLEKDDVCLTFSNGVADNLYKGDILMGLECLEVNSDEHMTLEQVADLLLEQSRGPKGESDVTADCLDDEPIENEDQTAAPVEEKMHPDGMPESWLRAMEQLDAQSDDEDEDDRPRPSFPYATAAALEFRRRVLELSSDDLTDCSRDSMYDFHEDAQYLMALHEGRGIFDRHIELACPNRKPHYSLPHLKRMALSQARKPDDITLFITRFA